MSSSSQKAMDLSTLHPSYWASLLSSPFLFPYHSIPENYIHWTETPESHIYSREILCLVGVSGVRKEEIRVEMEDSIYLVIRTESATGESTEPAKSFMRKFRLPGAVDVNGISAGYENGVLTVTVPRSFVRRGFFIEPADLPQRLELLARAA
ncbi:15.4 kDa class V heat shock protein [Rhododendron vialii]|uniref:15.4 kDa class V heat shock protein n=1 Tax=Rhododendron vialii TaxID=182163 RepID=UPI00265F26AE|nr:15.4 kDa class V heat shock protein [Rhododendron vialii]